MWLVVGGWWFKKLEVDEMMMESLKVGMSELRWKAWRSLF